MSMIEQYASNGRVRVHYYDSFHLFAYSRGVSYALGYMQLHEEHVCSLIVGDYPAEHRAMTAEWAVDYINNYLIPFKRTPILGKQRFGGFTAILLKSDWIIRFILQC